MMGGKEGIGMWIRAEIRSGLKWNGSRSVLWPLTLKFDRSTWPFLKIDRRHEAYRHEKTYYQHGMGQFLKSTGDIGLF